MSTALCTAETAEPPRKYRAVLSAAGELFMALGYAGVSMDAVAKTAGVSKATLYAYLPSKEALLEAVIAERCVEMAAQISAVAVHDVPLPEAVRLLADGWLRFVLNPRSLGMYRMVIAENARFPELARRFYDAGPARGTRWIAGWIAEEQRRGRLRPELDPAVAAGQVSALIRGDLFNRVVLDVEQPSEERVARAAAAATEVLLRAFAVPQADCESTA